MKTLKKPFILFIVLVLLFSIFTISCANDGLQGPPGVNGQKGADGSIWHTGYTIPIDSLGKNGDMYLDVNSRDFYKKENSKWSILGNMQGKDVKKMWNEDGTLRILAIGNSFTEDATEFLPNILKDLGINDFFIQRLLIAGCSLEQTANLIKTDSSEYRLDTNSGSGWTYQPNSNLLDTLKSSNWDYVTIQQASHYSGIESTYDDLNFLVDTIENLKPNAKIVWHMTWAYQQDSTHPNFPDYNSDQFTMYNAIVETLKNKVVTNLNVNYIIPNGTTVQNARTSAVGDTLTRDGYHLHLEYGRYLAALTYAYTMTGYDISKINYAPSGLNDALKNICIESVLNAVKRPYVVTNSQHTDINSLLPDLTETHVILSDYGWNNLAYWQSAYDIAPYNPLFNQPNSISFICTKMFDRTTLPIGSVIEIDSGYQYRPDAWIGTGVQPTRPGLVTIYRIVVDEAWWGDYDTRAFNVSKIDTSSLVGIEDQAKAAFRIWLPK